MNIVIKTELGTDIDYSVVNRLEIDCKHGLCYIAVWGYDDAQYNIADGTHVTVYIPGAPTPAYYMVKQS